MFGHEPNITIINLDAEQSEHWHHLFRTLANLMEGQMAVSTAVQANLDAIRQTQSLVKAVGDGLALQGTQISGLNAQIAALQGQIAAGATLSADDLAALAETGTDIAAVNTSLQSDIPANTPPAGAPSAPQSAPADAGTKPAAPLAGTGQT